MAEEKALREKYRLRLVKRLAQDKIVHPNEYVAYPNEQAKALVSARIAAERAQEEAMKAHR